MQKDKMNYTLNEVKSIQFEIHDKLFNVEFFFSKDPVWGTPIHGKNVWLVITISKPDSVEKERFKVSKEEEILNASESELNEILKNEVRSFLKK